MRTNIKQSQLENMIAECVGEVLAESRQPRQQNPAHRVMNEAQLNRYIQNIINEEMENEGFMDGLNAMGNKIFGDAKKAGRDVKAAALKKGRQARDFANRTGEKVGNAMNQVAQYGKDVMQTGKNASAAADAKKMADQIDALYQKYKPFFKDAKKDNQIRTAKSALLWLSQSFGNGLNADE